MPRSHSFILLLVCLSLGFNLIIPFFDRRLTVSAGSTTFGYTSAGATMLSYDSYNLFGSWFTTPAYDDIEAVNITVYARTETDVSDLPLRCGIYEYDSSTDAGALVAETEEILITNNIGTWFTCDFSSPVALSSSTEYFLVAETDYSGEGGGQFYGTAESEKGVSISYYGALPDPLDAEDAINYKVSIYAGITYTQAWKNIMNKPTGTFGNTTAGTSSALADVTQTLFSTNYTLTGSSSRRITSLHAYATATSQNVTMGIYNCTHSVASGCGDRIAVTETKLITSEGWQEFNFTTPPTVSPGTYALCLWMSEGGDSLDATVFYDAASGEGYWALYGSTSQAGPSNMYWVGDIFDLGFMSWNYSMYADWENTSWNTFRNTPSWLTKAGPGFSTFGNDSVEWKTKASGYNTFQNTPRWGGPTILSYTQTVYTANGTWTRPSDIFSITLLVVAGGGGGGANGAGAGAGGAGGLYYNASYRVGLPTYAVIRGNGGNGVAVKGYSTTRSPGFPSSFGSITTVGGGGGSSGSVTGQDGGSGGGGNGGYSTNGGSGTAGPPRQGYNGGKGKSGGGGRYGAGGGGGAGGVGQDSPLGTNGGAGGPGLDYSSVFGTSVGTLGWFAAGSGGGSRNNNGGAGGTGGGVAGTTGNGINAPANTGVGGGGGGGYSASVTYTGGKGGSGIIIVKYVNVAVVANGYNTFRNTATWTVEAGPGYSTFNNAPSWTMKASGWNTFIGAEPSWTTKASGWNTFQNTSSWSDTSTGWNTFSNQSIYHIIDSGWNTFGSERSWMNVTEGWSIFGNAATWQGPEGYNTFQNISSWVLLGSGWSTFGNISSWDLIESGWNTFQSTPSWTNAADGWNTFTNQASYLIIGAGWNTFGNASAWVYLIIDGWNTFGNIPYWTNITYGWNTFGHTATWQGPEGWNTFQNISLFVIIDSGWNTFGSDRSWMNVTDGWNTFGNSADWTNIITGWNTFANYSSYIIIDDGWNTFGALVSWTNITEGWNTFNNSATWGTTDEGWNTFENGAWQTIIDGWNTFNNYPVFSNITNGWNNFSNSASWNDAASGWNTFGNSISWASVDLGWNRFGNTSFWVQYDQGWNTFGNASYMAILDIFPSNGSTICPTCYENDTFFYFSITVGHANGTLMDIVWSLPPGDYSTEFDSINYGGPTLENHSGVYANVNANTSGSVIPGHNYLGQYISGGDYYIDRSYLIFNTTTLPDDAVINSAYITMVVYDDQSATDFNVSLRERRDPAPHNPMQSLDYFRNAFVDEYATRNTSGYTDEDWFNLTLPIAAYPDIDPAGHTKFGLRSDQDVAQSAPLASEYIGFYGPGGVNPWKAPHLIINYTLPNTTIIGELHGVGNGTYHIVPLESLMPISYNSSYTYVVNVTDGVTTINQTIVFFTNTQSFCEQFLGGGFTDEEFAVVLLIVCFTLFFVVGYRSKKRSGGAFMLLSGFFLIALAAVINILYAQVFIIPFAVFIIVIGIRKWLFRPNKEKTKTEGE